jgi:uncharacterized protein
MPDLAAQCQQLLETLRSYQSCAVAFSGGVDSAVVAKAAQLALGRRAVAVTGVSPSLASGELEDARQLADLIGIRHIELKTDEISNPSYVANAGDRCYHCKSELYTQLETQLERLDVRVIVNGANADDQGDYRPGMRAAGEHHARSPLIECGLTKKQVRQIALSWNLPVADKPATPCLSSRIAYGEQVTPKRLEMVDRAEQFVRKLGLRNVRVRYHTGELARIEVPAEAIASLAAKDVRDRLADELKQLGFKFITLDLEGFRSGSLNDMVAGKTWVPVEALADFGSASK